MAQQLIHLEIPVTGIIGTQVAVEPMTTNISLPLTNAVPVVVVWLQFQNGTSTLITMQQTSTLQNSQLLTKNTQRKLLMF